MELEDFGCSSRISNINTSSGLPNPQSLINCLITFEVEDTAFDITSAKLDTLLKALTGDDELKAFIQTSMSQKSQEETGLGLAITHRLELLEGKTSLFSDAF